jgi:molybdenum cofactor cytidylyltransferase
MALTMKVAAVVLAADKPKRTRQSKVKGKTVIDNILDALSAADISEQVVVLGYEFEKIIEVLKPMLGKVKIALNFDYERGVALSIQTGLIVLSNVDAAFMVLGDEPILDPKILNSMVEAMQNSGGKAQIVTPVFNGKKGQPLLIRKDLFGEILTLDPSQNLSNIVQAHADRLVTVEAPEWTIRDSDALI